MPSSNRPPLITSIVEASFAVRAGFRKPVQMTMWPIRTRSVTIASADSVENDSNVISSVGSGTVVKWSKTHADSNPSASACRARSTVRAHASAASQPSYSPFQPWGINRPTSTGASFGPDRTAGRPIAPPIAGLATPPRFGYRRSSTADRAHRHRRPGMPSPTSQRPRAPFAVVVALVVAGCGSGVSLTSPTPATSPPAAVGTGTPLTEAPPSPAAAASLPTTGRIEVVDRGYALTLPDNWFRIDLDEEGVQDVLDAGANELPEQFGDVLRSQLNQMIS